MSLLAHLIPAAVAALCRRRPQSPLPYPPPAGLVVRQWWHRPNAD